MRVIKERGIYKRKDSEFYWIRYSFQGKQFHESTKSERIDDARDLLAKRRDECRDNTFYPAKNLHNPTIGELEEKYLNNPHTKEKKSLFSDIARFKYIKAYFTTDRHVRTIFDTDIISFINWLDHHKKLAKATINRILVLFKASLKQSAHFDNNWNPFVSIKKFQENNIKTGTISVEQFKNLCDNANPELKAMMIIAYNLGLRRNSILYLEKSNIDFATKTLMLPGVILKNGMTYSVPINDDIVDALKALPETNSNRFFSLAFGTALSRQFKALCTKLGYTCTFHDFRRVAATNMLDRGIDSLIVASICGWKDLAMVNRYQKLSVEQKRKALGW